VLKASQDGEEFRRNDDGLESCGGPA
jgi:hypothetical protein